MKSPSQAARLLVVIALAGLLVPPHRAHAGTFKTFCEVMPRMLKAQLKSPGDFPRAREFYRRVQAICRKGGSDRDKNCEASKLALDMWREVERSTAQALGGAVPPEVSEPQRKVRKQRQQDVRKACRAGRSAASAPSLGPSGHAQTRTPSNPAMRAAPDARPLSQAVAPTPHREPVGAPCDKGGHSIWLPREVPRPKRQLSESRSGHVCVPLLEWSVLSEVMRGCRKERLTPKPGERLIHPVVHRCSLPPFMRDPKGSPKAGWTFPAQFHPLATSKAGPAKLSFVAKGRVTAMSCQAAMSKLLGKLKQMTEQHARDARLCEAEPPSMRVLVQAHTCYGAHDRYLAMASEALSKAWFESASGHYRGEPRQCGELRSAASSAFMSMSHALGSPPASSFAKGPKDPVLQKRRGYVCDAFPFQPPLSWPSQFREQAAKACTMLSKYEACLKKHGGR